MSVTRNSGSTLPTEQERQEAAERKQQAAEQEVKDRQQERETLVEKLKASLDHLAQDKGFDARAFFKLEVEINRHNGQHHLTTHSRALGSYQTTAPMVATKTDADKPQEG